MNHPQHWNKDAATRMLQAFADGKVKNFDDLLGVMVKGTQHGLLTIEVMALGDFMVDLETEVNLSRMCVVSPIEHRETVQQLAEKYDLTVTT